MRVTIYDVGHGSCVFAVARNGNCILVDCGHKSDPPNLPSQFLPAQGCTGIEYLIITNYDEDHISDLPRLQSILPIISLTRNRSITADQLRALKLQDGPITSAMQVLLMMHAGYTAPLHEPPPTPGISFTTYSNKYPSDFTDTNNISLVCFMSVGDTKFIFPGDLGKPGWDLLLRREDFRSELSTVDVFLASHHGRQDGYHPDVFQHCDPDVVVFSDGSIQYGTQDMTSTYAKHSRGIEFNGQIRKVLTTRSDGSLTWTID